MYIPLYNKTNYTLLSSLLTIDDLVNHAIKNNLDSISITDTNMYGTMEFIKKCNKNNIKPIIGLELLIENNKVVVFALNYNGYINLMKLSTIQNKDEVTISILKKYSKDIILVIPYQSKDKYDELSNIIKETYLGYSNKLEENEISIITKNIIFFRESLYLNNNLEKYLTYLYLIRDSKTISDSITYDTKDHELEIDNILLLSDSLGLSNTINLANKINIEFPEKENLLPLYPTKDPAKYLFELSKKGLSKRLNKEIPTNYKERLSYELNVINNMGFPNYFLVVYDFIKYAKKNNILVGPGRGSAAGSLVAYSLGITDIDPIKYGLLFERFLNPERKTMPDIDTDFPDDKRSNVIDCVIKTYGEKKVAGIVTFGTLAAKQVIRDVSRVLNVPLYKVDSLTHRIPNFTKDSLNKIYNNDSSFKSLIDGDDQLKNVLEISKVIEGFPRHTSSHAAGIVISNKDLDEVVPLTTGDGMYLTSYTMEYLEDIGLLKMDFLGLKNLTIISNIIDDIEKTYSKKIKFADIPLDSKETMKLFYNADTCGIFQFESSGMRNFLRKLKPTTLEDIFAAIALFRPGAASNIDNYIARRHGKEKVTYIDPSFESFTKNTYGILIYQEQIMNAASAYAGYSLGEADILRRAMSKKKKELLEAEEDKFIEKSIKKKHSKEDAKKVFKLILNFAGYGFNRSHSVVYSTIACKMAYLKANYPDIFFANLLTNVIGSASKTNEYLNELKKTNIKIEKPDINKSTNKYIVEDKKIIFPLSNIKSIGTVIANNIIEERNKSEFKDIYDLFKRLVSIGINKKVLETLIYSDSFRNFSYNRATLIYNLDSLYNYAELAKDLDEESTLKPEIIYQKDYYEKDILEKEKELFGFYLTNHPTSMYKDNNITYLKDINNNFNKLIDIIILIDKIKVINTKKGDKMAFITGSDETDQAEFTVFPKVYSNINLERNMIVKIRGRVEKRLDNYQIIVERIKELEIEKDK